jgi:hypothetical protein
MADSESYLGKLNADNGLSNATDEALLTLLDQLHEPRHHVGLTATFRYLFPFVTTARGILFLITFIIERIVWKGRQRLENSSELKYEMRRRNKAILTFSGEESRPDNVKQRQTAGNSAILREDALC